MIGLRDYKFPFVVSSSEKNACQMKLSIVTDAMLHNVCYPHTTLEFKVQLRNSS